MITQDHPTGRWFVVARHYPTAFMARMAWERAEAGLPMDPGEEGVGIVRLAPRPEGGIATGCPPNAHSVVVITVDEHTGQKAARLLRGEEWEPTPGFINSLIMRRMRAVVEHSNGAGRAITRRPEGQGAMLSPSGNLIDP